MGNSQFFSKLTVPDLHTRYCVPLHSFFQPQSHAWFSFALWGSCLFLPSSACANPVSPSSLNGFSSNELSLNGAFSEHSSWDEVSLEESTALMLEPPTRQVFPKEQVYGVDVLTAIRPISTDVLEVGPLESEPIKLRPMKLSFMKLSFMKSGPMKLGPVKPDLMKLGPMKLGWNDPSPNTGAATSKPGSKSELISTRSSRRAADLSPGLVSQPITPTLGQNHISWLTAKVDIPTFQATNIESLTDDSLTNNNLTNNSLTDFPMGAIADSSQAQPSLQPSTDPNRPSTVQPTTPTCEDPDPELGCLRLQSPWSTAAKPPVLYLIPRIDFLSSNNVLSGVDPIDDGLLRSSLQLLVLPPLGKSTYLIASIEGSLNRYFKVIQFNYDELKFRAGLFQQLSPTMSAEIGWTNQKLFISGNDIPGISRGTRFLDDHALRLEISRRDQLAKRLFLNSFYQFRVSFADPDSRSRLLNVLFLSLNYDFNPKLQTGLDLQFSSTNYTKVPRTDLYYQLLGRVTYSAFRNSQISFYGGLSLGSSTEPGINFDSYVLGVSMSVNLAIF